MSYNPAERSILVTSPADGGIYEIVNLPRDASGAVEPTDMKRGQGNSAIFVARNRFAVFSQATQQIDIKDLTNSTTKLIKPPPGTVDIYFGGTGCLLLITPTAVVLFDIQQKKQLAELALNGVKYVVWSNDGLYAALLSKHNVTIVTKNLEQVSTLHETIRIKSAAWDDAGVLLYSTLNHIKYTLLNGDNGIVRTLDQTVYLVRVKARSVYCLDRASKPKVLEVDPTEYRFKLALVKRNYEEMLGIIRTSSLVGQSIISYLQKKGYPEIALQFVQDPQTRFELAIECGNLEVAVDMAKQLDRLKMWQRLSTEALAHGNHQVVEMAYQKLRNFDKLSFLYLSTGDEEKLSRMGKIAEHRGDFTSRFQNALYMGDVENRIQMFQEIDLYPLAYMTAKSHGLEQECQNILDVSGLTEDQMNLPVVGKPLQPPKSVVPTYKANWPVKATSTSFFEKALLGEVGAADEDALVANGYDHADGPAEDEAIRDGQLGEEEEDAAGWDMGDDINVEAEPDFVNVDSAEAGAGSSEADLWARNSPIAADHVAAGSFDTAMQLLNRQVGAVNFSPLKPRFLEIYQASKTYLPATVGLPPLINHVRRTVDETDPRKVLPLIPKDLESIVKIDVEQEGYGAMKNNKLEEGLKTFKRILYSLLVNAVASQQQVEKVKKYISVAAEYATAMALEIERRSLPTEGDENLKRSLELSAYFTIPKLERAHRLLALMAAMKFAFANKNLSSALSFAERILAKDDKVDKVPARFLEQARKITASCERGSQDKIDIEYDQFAEFDVCASSYTPIYSGSPSASCPFDGSKHHAEYKGKLCQVCEVCEIGAPASGIRLFAS
ncbi:MAG: hypothetical protein Q9214_003783 [Letrouitia sp. 1 TL-2023]